MAIKVNGKFVAGTKGKDGEPGKSAYEYAVEGGYTGTEEEFKTLIGSGPWLPVIGGTMTGNIDMGGQKNVNRLFSINFEPIPSSTPLYFSSPGFHVIGDNLIAHKAGSSVTKIFVNTPEENFHAANKKYVDDSIKVAITNSWASAY